MQLLLYVLIGLLLDLGSLVNALCWLSWCCRQLLFDLYFWRLFLVTAKILDPELLAIGLLEGLGQI